jgi:colicin import membrane protein
LGAVAELTLQMDEVHTVAARAARRLLQRHLQRERDFQVRRAITRALEEKSNRPSEVARHAQEEQLRVEAARQAEEEKQRAAAAQQAEEEERRAAAARQAEWGKRRAATARQAEEGKRRAATARQAEEEKRRAGAIHQSQEEQSAPEAARRVPEQSYLLVAAISLVFASFSVLDLLQGRANVLNILWGLFCLAFAIVSLRKWFRRKKRR